MLSYSSTINGQDLNTILNRFTDQNVKLRQKEKSDALRSWQPIVDSIVDFVRQRDAHCRFVKLKILPTGSYYERAKVGEPDEFDLMLEIENLELDAAPYEEYENDGMSEPPTGFTRVMIDRGEEVLWQREGCANSRGMLKATQIKAVFARIVREAVSNLGYQSFVVVKSEGPAVTLKITRNGKEYSIDLTLAIKDNSWPEDAEEWRTRHRNELLQRITYKDKGHPWNRKCMWVRQDNHQRVRAYVKFQRAASFICLTYYECSECFYK